MEKITLHTDRLIMRPWRDADRAPFAAMNADPDVMRYFPKILTRAESDDVVDRINRCFDENGWGFWALEIPETADFIGFTGLNIPRFDAHFMPSVEIGWRLAPQFWGKGYATEAAHAALAFGFDTLRLPEIVAFTTPDNAPSRAVMEKIGMTYDPADDFDHEVLSGRVSWRLVLYRALSERGV